MEGSTRPAAARGPARGMNRNSANRYVLEPDELWIGDGTALARGHVVVREDRIEGIGEGEYRGTLPVIRLDGLSLSPGLIDLQVCGAFGQGAMLGDIAVIG